jgi:uncharacterized membrane protein
MIQIVIYTRKECPLCDKALTDLERYKDEYPYEIKQIDIETDEALHEHYRELVPVIKIGPYTLRHPYTETDLRVTLSAAQDSLLNVPERSQADRTWSRRINKVVYGLARHWLAGMNLFVFLYVALPFAAPILMHLGYQRPASVIYSLYGRLCHQLAYRSWFLFGEQPVYPLELAGTDWQTYGESTGLLESDHQAASAFVGNEQLGYKIALCQRDVAIYGGILVAGLVYAFLRKWVKPLPMWAWFVFGIIPIAIDGGSQLFFGLQLPLLSALPIRESTPLLRTITGVLFGVVNIWLALPYIEESMTETRVMLAARFAADASGSVS